MTTKKPLSKDQDFEAEDNKADIKDSKLLPNGWEEKEVDEKDLQINKDAAESCPVNVIHIIDKDGKKII